MVLQSARVLSSPKANAPVLSRLGRSSNNVKPKRILLFFGVYEGDRPYAAQTLDQVLDLLAPHELTVHIQDDGSPSYVGRRLAEQFSHRVNLRLARIDQSAGYHGASERTLSLLHALAVEGQTYDYILRVDPDIYLASRRLARLFDENLLPDCGLVGTTIQMRQRDLVLWLADLVPVGWRRRQLADGRMEHGWEIRAAPVWWRDIGLSALSKGFRGRIATGALYVITWSTLFTLHERGWLSRSRQATGLVFGEDVFVNTLVRALGHPVFDINEFIPEWKADLFIQRDTPVDTLRSRQLDLLHPLKDNAWAQSVRIEM
jgi:hypothetical protein